MDAAARALLAEAARCHGRQVVSAAAAPAVAAGLMSFGRGGNAFDAAVTAALVETVALPMKCGLAGDLVALVREPRGPVRALIAIGAGAAALDHGARPARVGAASVGVPGAPDGYAALAALGRLGLRAAAAPAIRLAEDGVEWSPIAVRLTEEAEGLLRAHNGPVSYLPEGRLPRVGERLRLPGLAELLRTFVELGPELFFGPIGAAVADRVAEAGGYLTVDDLRQRPATWHEPERLHLGDGTVLLTTPAPTHGRALLRAVALAVLEGRDAVAAVRQARAEARAAGLTPAAGGTSVVTAADAEGNAVVLVHSNSYPQYGAGLVVTPWDLILNNRPGRGFDLEAPPEAANAPRAGRLPATTLHAWALERAGRTLFGGTPGGVNQMPWNCQTILDCLAEDGDLGRVVVAPRWAMDEADRLTCEADHALAGTADARMVPPLALRSVEQVLRLHRPGDPIEAAADPRTGARAAGL